MEFISAGFMISFRKTVSAGMVLSYIPAKPLIMKKILFVLAAFTLSVSAMAQGKGKSKNKQEGKHEKHNRSDRDDDDDNDNRNGRWNQQDNQNNQGNQNGVYNQNGQNGKYAKNVPAKVAQAFNRDYPGARNVSWTKSKGTWTATFNNGVFSNGTAVYRSNGQRVDNNSNYAQRRTTNRTGIFNMF
ncbi:MAG: hypothetical protein JWQ27_1599 [Ferruginibacter sp.]|nr:hypothetical protein [Ferruginibacter sp.]